MTPSLLSNTREEDLQTLKSLLLAFGHISGLKVNLDKSNIYGINLDHLIFQDWLRHLECKASGWPILYLGLPLGGNPRAGGFWDPVIERISRRLDGWQKAYLSFGGRITLIQSCLTHMPWIGEGKKDHLVRWDVVCKPKEIGGLGFGNISLRNLALLGKWLWRYPREGSALWHQVILSIYGSHSNGWDANTIVRWSHRCPWKAISQVFQEFSSFTRFVFSVLVLFSWNLNFRRNLSDSEIEDLEGLMRSLDGVHLSPSVPDARLWPLSSSGLFQLNIFSSFIPIFWIPQVFPSKFVWNSQIPFKVQSFIWLVAHKKVNTNDMLQVRRPYKALSPDICILCMKHGESADHIFLHCSLTIGLWHRLFQLAKMDWVPPRSILDMMYIKFNGFGSSKRGIALWQAANIALIRIVWRERNARIFEDKARNSESLWDSIVFLASLWAYCSKVFKGTPLNAIPLDWIAGPANKNGTCATCLGNFRDCPGHCGYLTLALPVYNVGYLSTIVDILKCICKVGALFKWGRRFILCFVSPIEAKRFTPIFPKERGLLKGWCWWACLALPPSYGGKYHHGFSSGFNQWEQCLEGVADALLYDGRRGVTVLVVAENSERLWWQWGRCELGCDGGNSSLAKELALVGASLISATSPSPSGNGLGLEGSGVDGTLVELKEAQVRRLKMQWVRRLGKEGMSWFGFEGGGAYGGLVLSNQTALAIDWANSRFQDKGALDCGAFFLWGGVGVPEFKRNRRMFQEEEKSDMSLKNLFLRALLEWFLFFSFVALGAEEGKQLGSRKIKWEAAAVGR
ncbi:putative ribonuclease H protein [Vitis vinifera]|uniref:DNA-directed RNA polymerase n=1 Tax=Vitis vinifera TaxID=29760 RepID=A0A438KP44_VITVI|nr:putative ribonuclease H protein [Vitis vinifera]